MRKFILIILILLIGNNINSQEFTKVYKSKSNCLINNNVSANDVMLQSLAFEVFNFKDITINIVNYNKTIYDGRIKIKAFVEKNDSKSYSVYVNSDVTYSDIFKILCHEFIHIKQYQDGRLQINGNIATFDGKEYDMLEVRYDDRPWEIEAIKEGSKLRKQLRNYKK